MQNRITHLFQHKKQEILNIYCTAGFPQLEDTVPVIEALAGAGVDMIELGIPFSDPIADGPTIQASNQQALENGMTLEILFEQLSDIRSRVEVPLILMGYINPVLQMGIERFCQKAQEVGIDGVILPDLPMFEYEHRYKALFETHNLSFTFLVSPQTTEERILKIDELTQGFIYMVSSDSTTGKTLGIQAKQVAYFERLAAMKLNNPRLIGFGIHNSASFRMANQYAHGAIIGSAFIKTLAEGSDYTTDIPAFVNRIRGKTPQAQFV